MGFGFVWAVGMYGIWIDASRHYLQQKKGRRMGEWRAIVDLGDAIQHELGPNLNNYSDEELKESLKAIKPIMYTVSHDGQWDLDQIVLSSDLSVNVPNASVGAKV
jgi:hypothetical protein